MARELPKVYEPQQVEKEIYQMWEDGHYFRPNKGKDAKDYFIDGVAKESIYTLPELLSRGMEFIGEESGKQTVRHQTTLLTAI